jgi:4-hydroxy-3-methylbut-2-enyl diphosphate reductase
LDEAADIIAALRQRFPRITGPQSQDICYASENRQRSVRQVAGSAELVLVVGSANSSNSNRLVEVARKHGAAAHLVDSYEEVNPAWLDRVSTVAVTAGASAPEILVQGVVNHLRERGFGQVEEIEAMVENVQFSLPPEIGRALAKEDALR